jgi:predicted transcriptional regulator
LERLKRVSPDDDLANVLKLMTNEDVNQLLVMDNGNIIGMVRRETLLSFINLRGDLDK